MVSSSSFVADKHVSFIKHLDDNKDDLQYWMTEHLRLSGVYWGLTALFLMDKPDALKKDEVIEYVMSCQNSDGGFGAHTNQDSHILYTLSGIQILAMEDALDKDQSTGVVMGDKWGERDTRFIYCAMSCLSIIGYLDQFNVDLAVEYLKKSMNFDGAFGHGPGAESHAGQVFPCLGALKIAKRTDIIDSDLLAWWLCERQLPNGGLNGRPQKLEDVYGLD